MPEPALIEIRNASIWRGSSRVFEKLDLQIGQHERVAILGPNGSGKSTLLKVLNRELYPASGGDACVRVLGRDRWNVWDLRKTIGFVSHDLQQRYTPAATALDVVLSGFEASIGVQGAPAGRVGPERIDAALGILDEVGLSGHRNTMLRHLSTGEQRRALLGRALVHRPKTLVLDEPTSGLDLTARFDYLSRIRSLAASGHSIVLATHHLNEIPPEIERIVLLDRGRVVADGAKADVLTGQRLSDVYRVPLCIVEIDSFFFAYPDG